MNRDFYRLQCIVEFLDSEMSEEQAIRILDDARLNLGQDDLEAFQDVCVGTPLYTMLREMQSEKGW